MNDFLARTLVVCIMTAVVCIFLRATSPVFSTLLSLLVCITVVGTCIFYIRPFFNFFAETAKKSAFSPYMIVPMKACGIGILTSLSADMCRDSGENALAAKAELAGKTAILLCALPVIKAIFQQIEGLLE